MNTSFHAQSIRGIPSAVTAGLALAGLLAGCTHETLEVKADKPPDPPGIPFYAKQGVCKRVSEWLEPQYTLTLGVAIDGGPPTTHTLVLSRKGYLSPATQSLRETLDGIKGKYPKEKLSPQACPAAIGNQWNGIAGTAGYTVVTGLDLDGRLQQAQTDGSAILVKNHASLGTQVDYTKRYYLNTRSPWVGTSQVDAKLADDGTLSEGSAQRDDETWSTILTSITSLVGDFTGAAAAAVPAATTTAQPSSGLTAEYVRLPACGEINDWPAPQKKVEYTYSLKTVIYRHHHEITSTDLSNGCSMDAGQIYGGNFTVSQEDTGDKDKKSDKAIEFSGSVTLPDDSKGKDKKGGDSKDAAKK
jgi:hypothetical protein